MEQPKNFSLTELQLKKLNKFTTTTLEKAGIENIRPRTSHGYEYHTGFTHALCITMPPGPVAKFATIEDEHTPDALVPRSTGDIMWKPLLPHAYALTMAALIYGLTLTAPGATANILNELHSMLSTFHKDNLAYWIEDNKEEDDE